MIVKLNEKSYRIYKCADCGKRQRVDVSSTWKAKRLSCYICGSYWLDLPVKEGKK